MDKNKTNVQPDVERLTKIWLEDAAEKFRVMPQLYNLLTTSPMTFDVSTKGVIVTLEVANHSQEANIYLPKQFWKHIHCV